MAENEDRYISVPTSSWHPGMNRFLVSLDGVLEGGRTASEEYCVWVRAGQRRVPVVWPADFRARINPLELLDSNGKVVARGGEHVSLTGAELAVDAHDPCMLGHARAFYVQDTMS
jgi:hypothetical protein